MADNIDVTPGAGRTIATDQIAGVDYPRGKIGWGADGAYNDVSAANPLPVSDAGGSLTVDGTVAITGSVAVTGTFYQSTQPVSAASLPLPSGAATAAKQPALGTAGSAASDVLTVQGVASMTALKVDGSAVTQPVSGTVAATQSGAWAVTGSGVFNVRPASPAAGDYLPVRLTDGTSFYSATGGGGSGGQQYAEDAAHASGDLGTIALAVRKDTATQLAGTDGDYSVLVTDASGRLHVNVGNTVAVTGTFWQATQPVSGTVAATQSGTWTVQPGNTANTTAWLVTGTGGTFPATQSGTWNVGTVTTVTTVAAVTAITNALPAGTNTIGNVSLVPTTSGGCSVSATISAASTNATSVKGSAGQLYGYQVFNNGASARYLKFYNKASSPTVGTDTPVLVVMVPAGGGAVIAMPNGVAFGTGIALAITGGIANSDTTAVSANEVVANILYK